MATSVDVQIDTAKFRAWVAADGGDVDRYQRAQADAVAQRARDLAPSGKTGALKRSIGVEQNRDAGGRFAPAWAVVAVAPYAMFVHEGTRPHPIRGNPLLAFWWAKIGSFVVLARVNHPGTTGQPFLADAIRQTVV